MDDPGGNYKARENMWDEAWPGTGRETATHASTEPDNLDEMAPYPQVTGTTDALEAVRDGEPYTPPTDPPVLPGGPEGIHMATGFGTSAEEEAVADGEPRGDEDIHDEALLTLRQDSLTSKYALDVDVLDGYITLRGLLPSFEDAEYAMSLLGNLPGVVDVIDETTADPNSTE